MPTYEVRNRRTKMVLAEVVVERAEEVVDALLDVTGSTIEDLAASFGGTLDEVAAALDIVEMPPFIPVPQSHSATRPLTKAMASRRRKLYGPENRA